MDMHWMKEGIGYAASLIILVSMLMTNVYRLRQINLAGALLFYLWQKHHQYLLKYLLEIIHWHQYQFC